MGRPILEIILMAALTVPAIANAETVIPQQIIDLCNAAKDPGDLPNCLKKNTVAFSMIELAQTEDFYGEAGARAMAECMNENETLTAAWTCFHYSAGKAVETRTLIGVENIADTCIAALSDPEILKKLDEAEKQKRDELQPRDDIFGETFSSYSGCPSN